MNLTKTIHYILFITAFIYLIMCPAVHDFDDNIRYDLVRKVGVKKTQYTLKKGGNPTLLQLTTNSQTAFLISARSAQELLFFSSSYSTLNLTILSNIRLIL